MHFVEQISKKSGLKVLQILQKVKRLQVPPSDQDRTWAFFFVNQQIEAKTKQLFNMFKGGYSHVLYLISYLDLLQFLLKHKVVDPSRKYSVYLALCE